PSPRADTPGHPPEQTTAAASISSVPRQVGTQPGRVAGSVDPALTALARGGVRHLSGQPAGDMTAALADGDKLAAQRPDRRIDDARQPPARPLLDHQPTPPTHQRLKEVGSASVRR